MPVSNVKTEILHEHPENREKKVGINSKVKDNMAKSEFLTFEKTYTI